MSFPILAHFVQVVAERGKAIGMVSASNIFFIKSYNSVDIIEKNIGYDYMKQLAFELVYIMWLQ